MSLWGILNCPRWINSYSPLVLTMRLLPFSLPKVRRLKRIGPHNFDILSILIGSMLGDCSSEKRNNSTRFSFQQEGSHSDYLLWLHRLIANLGYCSSTIPNLFTRLGKGGKLRLILRFKTFSFASFNWIYDGFYPNDVKVVPYFIEQYLSPLALAIWIMNDGALVSSGLKLTTNNFDKKDVEFLRKVLNNKYSFKASVISTGVPNQYNIYISKASMPLLSSIIKPYMHPSMYYKLNGH